MTLSSSPGVAGDLSAADKQIISVIIPNYDGLKFLAPCLSSLLAQDVPGFQLEVLLIDNGSHDGSAEFVRQEFPSVIVIENVHNLGFTRATNQGLAAAHGAWILLLNNDTVMERGALQALLKELSGNGERIGGVQPLLLWIENPAIIDSTGIAISRRFRARDNQQGLPVADAPRQTTDVWGVCFGCALLRRAVFDECGTLDPQFFADWDDVDFCLRARWMSWRFLLVPESVVLHHRSPTMKRLGDLRLFRLRRNMLLTYVKGLPWHMALGRVLYRFQRDIFMLPHYWRKRQVRMIGNLWFETLRLAPHALRARRQALRGAHKSARDMTRELRKYMYAGFHTAENGLIEL